MRSHRLQEAWGQFVLELLSAQEHSDGLKSWRASIGGENTRPVQPKVLRGLPFLLQDPTGLPNPNIQGVLRRCLSSASSSATRSAREVIFGIYF